jgi:hypothetical protein
MWLPEQCRQLQHTGSTALSCSRQATPHPPADAQVKAMPPPPDPAHPYRGADRLSPCHTSSRPSALRVYNRCALAAPRPPWRRASPGLVTQHTALTASW